MSPLECIEEINFENLLDRIERLGIKANIVVDNSRFDFDADYPNACVNFTQETKTLNIWINSAFSSNKEMQQTILAHEIGHLLAGHLYNESERSRIAVSRSYGSDIATQQEIEADNYMFYVSQEKGKKFLYESLKEAESLNCTAAVNEINKRLDNLDDVILL